MSEGSRQSLIGTSGKPRRKRSSQSTRRGSNQLVTETPSLWLKIARLVRREDGGAIVEFVALAIPLFIPIFIYLNSFSSVSANEVIARSMAREVLRVYVISENDGAARNLSSSATQLLARQWNLSPSEMASLRTHMDCSHFPCLTANGRIKLTISFIDDQTQREVSASAQEHLSPWL
jgi:hypothetical protein